jgi:RNA polymerase-binding transcription factor DksA
MEFIFMLLLGVIAALLLFVVFLLLRTPAAQPAVVITSVAAERTGCGVVSIEQKLQAEMRRWETVAMHAADQACFDSQINSIYCMAQDKQAKIARAMQCVESGAYKLCNTCGKQIEEGRLELLVDSDCRQCAACATAAAEAQQMRRPHRPLRKPSRSHRYPAPALEFA